MRNGKFVLSAIVGLGLIASCSKPVNEVTGCQFPSRYETELVWADEFNEGFINTEYWGYDTADGCQLDTSGDLCGWGNNELQYYTMREENARVEDGKLIITARKEDFGGRDYTSARLVTKNKVDFTYGRVDVRAKLPTGQGLWPAIWLLHTDTTYGIWPASGEIDIMEAIGSEPNEVFSTIHYGHDFWRFDTQYLPVDSINFSEGFHTYTALWTEDCILFQVDGVDVGEPHTRSTVLPTTWPFDHDFHFILNIAVGGNLPGDPPNNAQYFPQTMEVDYVRLYQ